MLARCITFYIITNIQRTMPCITMGKHYIKTGVNVKNGIFQLPSASRRAAFETSIRQMVAPFCIFCKFMCGVASNCLQERGPSYPRGPSCPRLPYVSSVIVWSFHYFEHTVRNLYNKGKTRNLERDGIILAEFGSTRRFVDLLRWTH